MQDVYYATCIAQLAAWGVGQGPKHQNAKNVVELIFFTVFIHMNDLEMVCSHEKID